MSWLGEWGRRFGMLVRRERVATDLEDEMQLHIDMRREMAASIARAVATRQVRVSATLSCSKQSRR